MATVSNYTADLQFDTETREITQISDGALVMANAQDADFDSYVIGRLRKSNPEMFEPIYDAKGFNINKVDMRRW